jgi:hypothetical protein
MSDGLLHVLGTSVRECADGVGADGAPCSGRVITAAIIAFSGENSATRGGQRSGLKEQSPAEAHSEQLPDAPTAEARAVRKAAALLDCDSEACVLTHPKFRTHAAKHGVTPTAIQAELAQRFKLEGPRDSAAWLTNTHIDLTLQRWARRHADFFPCPFAMMDFETYDNEFNKADLLRLYDEKAVRTFACVLNTDTSRGPGKHWVSVFVDMRSDAWSIEYFNSTGQPPPSAVVRWLERTRAQHATRNSAVTAGPVSSLVHQRSHSECGVYSLFFIRHRLEGTPASHFADNVIPDAVMEKFRRHLFRKK